MQDRRLLILFFAGTVIAAVSTWRVTNNVSQDYAGQLNAAAVKRSVSYFRGDFEGLDADNRLIRLRGYLGRHRILLAFFDAKVGADKDVSLLKLRENFALLKAADVKVIAVSTALPQENRAAMSADRGGEFPFPLVTDVDPRGVGGVLEIHRKWSRLDPETNYTLPGIFFIDRKGEVSYGRTGPIPTETVEDAIAQALR